MLVLTACPVGLRGHLTRWLLEIAPGVFVGVVSTRVRELMWQRVVELAKDGRAVMVHSARGEQRLAFKVHRHDWQPVDLDGLMLICRPSAEGQSTPELRRGWSAASKRRMARRRQASAEEK